MFQRSYPKALWDTPGLLLDPSLSHYYPIRDFARIKAMKPNKIMPQWHDTEKKSFAFIVYENSDNGSVDDDDALPLLRIEVRLKKNAQHNESPSPLKLVWNSILNDSILSTRIISIGEALAAEEKRIALKDKAKQELQQKMEVAQEVAPHKTPEEKTKYKEMKQNEYFENKMAKIAELGKEEWERQKADEQHQQKQLKLLAALSLVSKDKIKAGKPAEISIEHFGGLGILSPSTDALVLVYAPSTGILPACHDMLAVPPEWEDFVQIDDDDDKSQSKDHDSDEEQGDTESDEEDLEDMEEWGFQMDDEWDVMDPVSDEAYPAFATFEPVERDFGNAIDSGEMMWSEYSGENIGWKFDHKPRFVRGEFVDGWHPVEEQSKP